MTGVRVRFWLESALATLSMCLALLTAIQRDWIERVFGLDPDQHSGAAEWLLVLVAVTLAVTLTAVARREWRRHQLTTV